MLQTDASVFELKETAKWSSKMDERRAAINELVRRGQTAIPTLEEIRDVALTNDELRNTVIAFIEEIRNDKSSIGGDAPNGPATTTNAAATTNTTTTTQKAKSTQSPKQ